MAKKLTRDELLAAQLRTEDVEAFGGTVTICEMPVGKRNKLMAGVMDAEGKVSVTPDLELRIFIAGMYDPPFTEDDAELLQSVSGAEVSKVAQAIMRLNGLSPDALDEARGES